MTDKCSHKTEVIRFRVATKDRKIFEAAAKRNGLTLSDWLRQAALLTAAPLVEPPDAPSDSRNLSLGEQSLMHKSLQRSVTPVGRPDPDKLAAFQKRAGMGGVKSRG